MAAAAEAPDDLSTIANVMPCPPMPFIPEAAHGQIVILALMCYAGDVEAGERAIAPFRALATPLADMVQAQPYTAMYPPEDPDYHPLAVSRTIFMEHVGDGRGGAASSSGWSTSDAVDAGGAAAGRSAVR